VVVLVVEAQLLVVAAGRGDQHERGGIDRGDVAVSGDRHQVGAERADRAPQPGGQHLVELGQRPDRRLLDADHRAAGAAQADGDGDGLLVVEHERRHHRPGAQPVAAAGAPAGVDRVAEAPQPSGTIDGDPLALLDRTLTASADAWSTVDHDDPAVPTPLPDPAWQPAQP
jgi:hypothetical protein